MSNYVSYLADLFPSPPVMGLIVLCVMLAVFFGRRMIRRERHQYGMVILKNHPEDIVLGGEALVLHLEL